MYRILWASWIWVGPGLCDYVGLCIAAGEFLKMAGDGACRPCSNITVGFGSTGEISKIVAVPYRFQDGRSR